MPFESILESFKKKARKLLLDIMLFNLIYIFYAILFYTILSRYSNNDENLVGFASNHLNGELKYIFDEMKKRENVKLFFVTDLLEEIERLKEYSVSAYYCRDIGKIPVFVRTKVWVTSHGPYYIPDYYLNKLFKRHIGKWVDTWHGVGVEHGSGDGRAKMLSYYDIAFVPSDFYRDYYISKQDQLAKKLKVTGSPRTDVLVSGRMSREYATKSLSVPQNRINILYAPSWGNPAVGETKIKCLFPFERDEEILDRLAEFCREKNCNFIIRPHPNWEDDNTTYLKKLLIKINESECLFYRSSKEYPLAEPVLCAIDVLITDYSSIANDFLVLNRHIIYLDKGLPEDKFIFKLSERGGFVVKDFDEMMNTLQRILDDPKKSLDEIRNKRDLYMRTIYKYTDGKASERCADEIMRLLR